MSWWSRRARPSRPATHEPKVGFDHPQLGKGRIAGFGLLRQGVALYVECLDSSCVACTGVMVTRIGGDLTPLFLTAPSCVEGVAPNGIAIWGFHTGTCNGVIPDPATLPQTALVRQLANSEDVVLLGLAEDLPIGVAFLPGIGACGPRPATPRRLFITPKPHSSGSHKAKTPARTWAATSATFLDIACPASTGRSALPTTSDSGGLNTVQRERRPSTPPIASARSRSAHPFCRHHRALRIILLVSGRVTMAVEDAPYDRFRRAAAARCFSFAAV